MSPTRAESEAQVSSWGFSLVFTWSDPPGTYYPPHTHAGLTTHLIRKGTMTILFPDDKEPKKETFGVGARVDVEAGRRHEVWVGGEGCEMVIGE